MRALAAILSLAFALPLNTAEHGFFESHGDEAIEEFCLSSGALPVAKMRALYLSDKSQRGRGGALTKDSRKQFYRRPVPLTPPNR